MRLFRLRDNFDPSATLSEVYGRVPKLRIPFLFQLENSLQSRTRRIIGQACSSRAASSMSLIQTMSCIAGALLQQLRTSHPRHCLWNEQRSPRLLIAYLDCIRIGAPFALVVEPCVLVEVHAASGHTSCMGCVLGLHLLARKLKLGDLEDSRGIDPRGCDRACI